VQRRLPDLAGEDVPDNRSVDRHPLHLDVAHASQVLGPCHNIAYASVSKTSISPEQTRLRPEKRMDTTSPNPSREETL
jgi:hypothetical protein